jgi:RNA 2',3'-cyclic 3'-phosphodiesterase
VSKTRTFFAAMMPSEVSAVVDRVLHEHALDHWMGSRMFAPGNRHQSFSERRFDASSADITRLQTVGARIRAHACTLQFNRIQAALNPRGKIYLTLQAKGKPKAFKAINDCLRAELREAGFADMATGVTAHSTLCYDAPSLIENIRIDPTINWPINELLLVVGGGDPYHYEIVDRWPLLPEIDPLVHQSGLF